MPFYIEKPGDEYGNTGYLSAVIEAVEVTEPDGYAHLSVIGPEEVAERWPTLNSRFFVRLSDDAGPARLLDVEEGSRRDDELRTIWEQVDLWPFKGPSEWEMMLAHQQEVHRRLGLDDSQVAP